MNNIREHIKYKVSDQIIDRILLNVGDQICKQVSERVYRQVDHKVSIPLRGLVVININTLNEVL
jgi:hypothetical protein